MDFRKVLARIFFLEFVADTFKIDPNSILKEDVENTTNMMMDDRDKRTQELGENLVGPSS